MGDSFRTLLSGRARVLAGLLLLTLSPCGFLTAQVPGDFSKITVEDLRPPLSPAFVVLGIEPASVQRPETPRAISTALLSLASDPSGIPRNFAMEVAPFWLKSRPSFEFDSLYGASWRTTLMRSSSISIATTPRVRSGDTTGTSIGFGYRALLSSGRQSKRLTKAREDLEAGLSGCIELTGEALQKCYGELRPLIDSLKANMQPVGFVMQFSLAASGEYPDNVAEGSRWGRVGAWLSPSWRFEDGFELIGVGRYMRERVASNDTIAPNLFDFGGRLLWRVHGAIALSAEAIRRVASGGDGGSKNSNRYGGLLEVRATNDLYVFYSFGRDFAATDAPRSRVFSTIGLNIGFGKKPLVKAQ
jgi:hypothetical protein